MKRFTKVMLAFTACLTLSVAMVAQEAAPTTGQEKKADAQQERHMRGGKMGRMGGGKHIQKMATELGLTDAQKTQIKSIHEQQRTKAMELRNNESLTQEQKMEQFKALRESTHSQVSSLLTADQQTKFAAMKAGHKGRMGKHGRKGRRGAWGDKAEGQKPDSTQPK